MSRRKRGVPPAPGLSMSLRPEVSPPLDALVAERRLILSRLIACGVHARDCEDVLQDVLIAAWKAIQAGRYRPDPRIAPRRALQGWLHGITWRQAGHHLGRAHVRREVPVYDPRALVDEGSVDLDGRLLARAALRRLVELPAHHRDLLLAAAGPHPLTSYAREHGLNPATAAGRLQVARKALAERIARPAWQSGDSSSGARRASWSVCA
ncbi:RNA polymerase sigma factor [Sorangium sp. So ce693]|uniref:RNA polymerase sigma factor n=1 Tax=Sorangium sp. So ce693 TaxID=3133318 RepID=UPI003F637B9C